MNYNLNQLHILARQNDLKQFGTVLHEMYKNSDDLEQLFNLFNDSYDDLIIFEVVHAVETLPDLMYVKSYLDHVGDIYAKAPRWAGILLIRIVNNPTTFLILKDCLTRNESDREIIEKARVEALKIKRDMPIL
jgi:hypothetical protein